MTDFEQLYRTYFSDVYLYIKRLSGDEHIAEEITSDTFLKAIKAIDSFRGDCDVRVTMERSETMLELGFAIEGYVICECDRCLEDCKVPIEYEGDLLVKFSSEIRDYDGEVMWISPADGEVSLAQYIYESIVLALPYSRVHEEGECNPDMLARFTTVVEDEEQED